MFLDQMNVIPIIGQFVLPMWEGVPLPLYATLRLICALPIMGKTVVCQIVLQKTIDEAVFK